MATAARKRRRPRAAAPAAKFAATEEEPREEVKTDLVTANMMRTDQQQSLKDRIRSKADGLHIVIPSIVSSRPIESISGPVHGSAACFQSQSPQLYPAVF